MPAGRMNPAQKTEKIISLKIYTKKALLLHMIRAYFHIRAGTIAACDPDSDSEGRAITAGLTFAQALVPEGGFDSADGG